MYSYIYWKALQKEWGGVLRLTFPPADVTAEVMMETAGRLDKDMEENKIKWSHLRKTFSHQTRDSPRKRTARHAQPDDDD
jgi:hypothetical protein